MTSNKTKDRKHQPSGLRSILLGFMVSSAAVFAPAFADDTEVFFGQVDPEINTYPNVLFVLDTSGSMNWGDSGYTGSRLERMKSALNTILDNSTNVNVGLMRFNGLSGGGSVLYPVTGIEDKICPNNNCGLVDLSYQISEADDDMEQYLTSNGGMEQGGNWLSMGQSGNTKQLVGYRFQKLDIPSGATITGAHLEFTAVTSTSGQSDLSIYGHDVGDSPTIGTTNNYLSNQPRTSDATRVDWQPGAWSTGNVYQSPDVSGIVQEIVDRADWCGSQSMGFIVEGDGERAAYSYNNSPSRAAILRVTYDSQSVPSTQGCVRKAAIAQINNTSDDAFERNKNGKIVITSNNLRMPQLNNNNNNGVVTRLRFTDIAVPAGSIIEDASIEFEVDQKLNGAVAIAIEAEAVDDAPELVADKHWISNRPVVTNPVIWNITAAENWDVNTKVPTPDLAAHVQSIVNRPGWQATNAMAFMLRESGNTTPRRSFESYDGEQPAAAKLRISYRANIGNLGSGQIVHKTARDDMKQVVNELKATGGTPIVSAYYEAAQYMLGREVDYGTQRGVQKHRFHRVSHPDSYTGGSLVTPSGCDTSNPEDHDCTQERIDGTATYLSPLVESCQTNHIVFLSDGVPTSNTAISKIKNLIGAPSCDPSSGREACGRELATWLNETDHNDNIAQSQNISTYTIGFNINSDFLSDIATAGGGTYYDASSSEELVAVFQNILGDVLAVDTSFVAPGATVNQFNRLTHRNDIYFALFKPDARPSWDGNLKRYHVGENSDGNITIQDKNGNPAVDEDSGFFSSNAKSWWSDSVDGSSVEAGGAASKISLSGPQGAGSRRVFTFTGSSIPANGVDLTANAQMLHESNNGITEADLGLSGGTADDRIKRRSDLLKWARGVDVQDEDLDGDETDVRQHMGDPMHARPVILNYDNGASTDTTIFVATNEGMLHAIEQQYGTELYSFMPQELLPNLNAFFENQQSTKHPYGLDGDLSIWHEDTNENVTVDAGETAYLYVGMRRGGNHYYAFDVSDRLNPKLVWQIEGGTGDFAQLGQSWSRPVPTTIMHNNVERSVLIFAGGYDTNQDPNPANLIATQTPDSVGNAIYIVDAKTGDRIWAGQGNTGGDQQFSAMDYSIPADIRVIDIDANGLADQMYVGDMGGQLWRFDFQPFHQSGPLVHGGVIADFSGSGIGNARRFYNEPDVALIAQDGERFLSISIGSGWRAHPLNEDVEDRFYMVRSNNPYSKPEGYGKNAGSASTPIWLPITEADLANVTDDLEPEYNANGWFMELETSGEKVMGSSITINNQIIFTTYEPAAAGDACSPAIGGGAVYVLDVMNGAPTLDLDGSEGLQDDDNEDESSNFAQNSSQELTKEDRKKTLKQDGIPPSPTALITETNGNIGTTILVSTEQPVDVDFSNLTQRTYWQDNGRGSEAPTSIETSESNQD